MKTMKRTLSILLAVMLLACMLVVPASAVDTYTITIQNPAGKEYEAYQIFAGTLAKEGDVSILSSIVWGDGVNSSALLTALDGDTELGAYFDKTTDTGKTVAETLGKAPFTNPDHIMLDRFATIAAQHLINAKRVEGVVSGGNVAINGLTAGYYLVKAVDTADLGVNDVYTRYMLQVVDNITVSPKTSAAPVIAKMVSKSQLTGYAAAVSATIDRDVFFRLEGQLPSNIGEFNGYEYIFHDTLSTGLDFAELVEDASLDINDFAFYVLNKFEASSLAVDVSTMGVGVKPEVDVAGKEITITFPDAKAFVETVTSEPVAANDYIQVIYKATLNQTATIEGSGNKNEFWAEYSAQPNKGNAGPTAQTNPVSATVYTYQVEIHKVDPAKNGLAGAKFILYHNPAVVGGKRLNVELQEDSEGVYTVLNVGPTSGVDAVTCTEMSTNTSGVLIIKGLGVATFQLEETVEPATYNKLDAPAPITIEDKLGTGSQTVVEVVNYKGAALPETGGIGTTVFYIAGGLMVAAAAAVLLLRKRENG